MELGVAKPKEDKTLIVKDNTLKLRLSYYWPAWGGTNCFPTNFKDGHCTSWIYGKHWYEWRDIGMACSPKIKLGTKIYIEELKKTFMCVDRGGAIEDLPDGTSFVDLLQTEHPYVYKGVVVKDKWCPSGCFVVTGRIENEK